MTDSSLKEFGVPNIRTPILQPTYKNQFKVSFNNFGVNGCLDEEIKSKVKNALSACVLSVTRPTASFDMVEKTDENANTVYETAGMKWNDIVIKMIEDTSNIVLNAIHNQKSVPFELSLYVGDEKNGYTHFLINCSTKEYIPSDLDYEFAHSCKGILKLLVHDVKIYDKCLDPLP
jgi:antitoxin component of RelBE/YafQ-DinJ toxin-antitoxin module